MTHSFYKNEKKCYNKNAAGERMDKRRFQYDKKKTLSIKIVGFFFSLFILIFPLTTNADVLLDIRNPHNDSNMIASGDRFYQKFVASENWLIEDVTFYGLIRSTSDSTMSACFTYTNGGLNNNQDCIQGTETQRILVKANTFYYNEIWNTGDVEIASGTTFYLKIFSLSGWGGFANKNTTLNDDYPQGCEYRREETSCWYYFSNYRDMSVMLSGVIIEIEEEVSSNINIALFENKDLIIIIIEITATILFMVVIVVPIND